MAIVLQSCHLIVIVLELAAQSLKQIRRVLADASRKELTDDSVKEWLKDLQHLAYGIDDVIDGWLAEAMHREFTHESETMTSKVRKLIPSCCTNFSRNTTMLAQLDDISTKLQDLVKKKDDFGLRVEGETRSYNNNNNNNNSTRRCQSSIFNPSSIV
ncbi:uncharacterized protein LOC143579792 [Bidens hawaiensis]|uniref:uncharacterized protein LOC143579792 n=1 Tax=Bidens hawaiensis TaxID=980011 RepID=UPI00404AFBE2